MSLELGGQPAGGHRAELLSQMEEYPSISK